jgi:hypothetical protein
MELADLREKAKEVAASNEVRYCALRRRGPSLTLPDCSILPVTGDISASDEAQVDAGRAEQGDARGR